MRRIYAGKFVFTGELEPLKTANMTPYIKEGKLLKEAGCVAGNVTHNPKADATISSMAASYTIQKESGLECVYQLTCRDMNRMALVSDILGAAHLGLHNCLALTGDHPSVGDTPESKPVFDLDGQQLAMLVREIVDKHTAFGKPLKEKLAQFPQMHVGCAGNPNGKEEGFWAEIAKIKRKTGIAEFCQTQVVFDIEHTIAWCKEIIKTKIPVLIGIFPMKNFPTAKGFNDFVPGVKIPQNVLDDFKAVHKSNASDEEKAKIYEKKNVDFWVPFLKELRSKNLVAGAHVMAVQYASCVGLITKELGV
jgi:methylenetetrahydrofolate reductase (NADPH)